MCIFTVILWIVYPRESFIIVEDVLTNHRAIYYHLIWNGGRRVVCILKTDDAVSTISCIRYNNGKSQKPFCETVIRICDINF